MRLLLDSHVLLWALTDHARLGSAARRRIAGASEVFASVASIWEFAIKIGIGRLRLDLGELTQAATASGIAIMDVRAEHAVAVTQLPALHRDPFDRMLVAQAMTEGLRLLTSDAQLRGYGPNVTLI
jgi:PIN domain nuclease of toxin-antitoxin system